MQLLQKCINAVYALYFIGYNMIRGENKNAGNIEILWNDN